MSDTYVYKFENNLYINLTNKCSNNCTFCLRNNGDGIGENSLWLKTEPSAIEVIARLKEVLDATQDSISLQKNSDAQNMQSPDLQNQQSQSSYTRYQNSQIPNVKESNTNDLQRKAESFAQVVFCGYGESTYRLEELIKIADFLKERGLSTRLDTNGLGNLINGYDITPKLVGRIDTVSISLNQATAQKYDQISVPIFDNAFEEVQAFAQSCVQKGIKTILTVVDIIPKEDIEDCKKIAASLGATLRIREYIK